MGELLKKSNDVTAVDIDYKELEVLKDKCPKEFVNRLKTEVIDITKRFPYQDETYDKWNDLLPVHGLHLFLFFTAFLSATIM